MARLDRFFRRMLESGASDLHLSSGVPPMLRVDGEMRLLDQEPALAGEDLRAYLEEIAPAANKAEFGRESDTDFAYELPGAGRFRANLFMDNRGPGAVFRLIPPRVPSLGQLGLPAEIQGLCDLKNGLVVVTGPTGSGKSTTLAAMIDHINARRHGHIVTIEDPIEFVHAGKNCLVNQREVRRDTQACSRALRAALREDPDVILVGEMRDRETFELAVEAAETGHLVLTTLHTRTAVSAVDRIVDQFPADRQKQIRGMLAASLKGVVAQTLCKKIPQGRVAALEILLVTNAAASNIRDGQSIMLTTVMQVSRNLGMRTLNISLIELVQKKTVAPLEAYLSAVDKSDILEKFAAAHIPFDTALVPAANAGMASEDPKVDCF